MRARRSQPSSARSPGRFGAGALGEAMMAARSPVDLVLSAAVRRVARCAPGVFERLGEFQSCAFLIAPTELPVAFRLEPNPVAGRVRVVRRTDRGPFAARIAGPLAELLGLFDGSLDADAAFFNRSIQIEGDTGAVVALHNTLEAADLSLADLLGVPFGRRLVNGGFHVLLSVARRQTSTASA